MNLYHYSKRSWTNLKTLEAQGGSITGKPGGEYGKHISFFFEPVPLDIVGAIFKNHDVWHSGNKLFEHITDEYALGEFRYLLTESPGKNALRYDDRLSLKVYERRLKELEIKEGYRGSSTQEMIKACESLKGQTRECFLALPTRPDWESIRDKYAATVPHLMIYPKTGIVKVKSIRSVTVK